MCCSLVPGCPFSCHIFNVCCLVQSKLGRIQSLIASSITWFTYYFIWSRNNHDTTRHHLQFHLTAAARSQIVIIIIITIKNNNNNKTVPNRTSWDYHRWCAVCDEPMNDHVIKNKVNKLVSCVHAAIWLFMQRRTRAAVANSGTKVELTARIHLLRGLLIVGRPLILGISLKKRRDKRID